MINNKTKHQKLIRAAPLLLAALEQAYWEMEYQDRPGSRIARRAAKEAIIKATGCAPRSPWLGEIKYQQQENRV